MKYDEPRGQLPVHHHPTLSKTPEQEIGNELQWQYKGMRWGTMPAKEKAMQAIINALDTPNPRIQMMAVRNLLIMERQNQIDQMEAKRPKVLGRLNLNYKISDSQAIEAKRQLGLESDTLSIETVKQAIDSQQSTNAQQTPPPDA